jgi:hypothetical protein
MNVIIVYLDEIAIFSEVLSSAEVDRLYNGGRAFDLTIDRSGFAHSSTLIEW